MQLQQLLLLRGIQEWVLGFVLDQQVHADLLHTENLEV